MKILIVCSLNSGSVAPFILEQVESLQSSGAEIDYFYIKHKGLFGYLGERKSFLIRIKSFQPKLIHAHYGLSGLLANLQFSIPVVTTFHGSDINDPRIYPFSLLASKLSFHSIFVSERNRQKVGISNKQSFLPCGVNTDLFQPIEKDFARRELGLELSVKYVLFAGAFQNPVKNAKLAQAAVELLPNVILLELKGYTREQVVLLMNAVDAVLMTSLTEGSPQFIKEAMACNCPIVSVPVGDVSEIVQGVLGCRIATYDAFELSNQLQIVLQAGKRTEGRLRIFQLGLDATTISGKVLAVYRTLILNRMDTIID